MVQNFSEEDLKKLHLFFSDEELEEILSSERVDNRSDQIARTSRIYVAAHYILLLVVSILWAASNVTLTMGSTHWTDVSNVLLVLAIVATLAVITINLLHRRY